MRLLPGLPHARVVQKGQDSRLLSGRCRSESGRGSHTPGSFNGQDAVFLTRLCGFDSRPGRHCHETGGRHTGCMRTEKECTQCHLVKPAAEFYPHGGRDSPRLKAECKTCHNLWSKLRKRINRMDPAWRKIYAERAHRARANVARTICSDSKKADKRFGRIYAMTVPLVEAMIRQPCTYCAGTELRMTLDRKDNTRGHTPDNVVPCCTRCNYVRRDMPYAAWLLLAPSMRLARESGAFGTWTCQIHHRHAPIVQLAKIPPSQGGDAQFKSA